MEIAAFARLAIAKCKAECRQASEFAASRIGECQPGRDRNSGRDSIGSCNAPGRAKIKRAARIHFRNS